jgi:hypothetical protein
VQKIQQVVAATDYFSPALDTARNFGLKSELGVALCFDIHVQNGGINKRVLSLLGDKRPAQESSLRTAMAQAVAKCARAEYRDDVLARKLAIATGSGRVHGAQYELSNWGLAEWPAEITLRAKAARAK